MATVNVVESISIFLFLLLALALFVLPPPSSQPTPRRSLLSTAGSSCTTLLFHPNGLLDYSCLLHLPFLLPFLLLFHFALLIRTASFHFSPCVSSLVSRLRLSPSMGAATLLALGNGAPDVFASLAAVRSGRARTGLGAILSAGAFVSALVVGLIAVYAAPFAVDPAPFVRDVFFYLLAVSGLFYVYLSAEIYLWQSVGLVGFYLFFVGFVFWMDLGVDVKNVGEKGVEMGLKDIERSDPEYGGRPEGVGAKLNLRVFCSCFRKISKTWKIPISILLKLTIPSTSPSQWSRFYSSSNIVLCPLILLYAFRSFIPLDHPFVFLVPQARFPLWSITLFVSVCFGVVHYILERDPPETEMMPETLLAFVMSAFWISTVAGELLNCLEAIGTTLDLPPTLLGLTVLAWGNSVGDLVADVAVAKAGQPALAMAGCFAGPMFNMLVGLGTALVIETCRVHPKAYELRFHISIVVAFVFLLFSLMGSLLVVTWNRFRVTKFWGFCLVGLYLLFTTTSLAIAKFSR